MRTSRRSPVCGEPGSFRQGNKRCQTCNRNKPHRRSVRHPEPGTILLVEDDKTLRDLARIALLRLGYTVLFAADSDSAIKVSQMHRDSIDLLIADVVLPGMNGSRLAERLRTLRPGHAGPVHVRDGAGRQRSGRRDVGIGISPETFQSRRPSRQSAGDAGGYRFVTLGKPLKNETRARTS
ncbi:MAG: hypothetical protein KatS3mg082_0012 [Nitrospiraceae bacterium]|nr:MAG: hypothetical protein KatS3mg082_0012 [Nitrospiraceae bacterium]